MAERKTDREGGATVLDPETKPKTKAPPLYKVVLHNDDYTPRFFVVAVLAQIFNKGEADAMGIMMHAHNNGRAVVGLYSFEIAEAKVAQAMHAAKENDMPLMFSVEPE